MKSLAYGVTRKALAWALVPTASTLQEMLALQVKNRMGDVNERKNYRHVCPY